LTIAHWCVPVLALLPIVCAGMAKWGAIGKSRRDGGYDNDNPGPGRPPGTPVPMRRRSTVLRPCRFSLAPCSLPTSGAAQGRVDTMALIYIALRSLVWTLAFAVNIGILFAGC
jgi:uncharacterized MAPEG superfamily protein